MNPVEGLEVASPPSLRTTLLRRADRAAYDPREIRTILEAGVFCHIAFVEAGYPVVVPTAYGLLGDALVFHGLPASRLLRRVRSGMEICVNVTIFDGLVLARSAFDHSMNYRSVVMFGQAQWVRGKAAKIEALRAVSDHVLPGRWADVRPPSEAELRQTHVLAIPLDEASAKVRAGPPSPESESWDTWTGVLPAQLTWGEPLPWAQKGRDVPEYLAHPERRVGT